MRLAEMLKRSNVRILGDSDWSLLILYDSGWDEEMWRFISVRGQGLIHVNSGRFLAANPR